LTAVALCAASAWVGLGSTAASAATFVVSNVYRNPPGTRAAAAEGKDFLGHATATTNANGNASWTLTVAERFAREVVNATATRLSTRNTSEFSGARVVRG
jgi:hypothetical protein